MFSGDLGSFLAYLLQLVFRAQFVSMRVNHDNFELFLWIVWLIMYVWHQEKNQAMENTMPMQVHKVKQECQRSSLGSEIISSDIKVESAKENSWNSTTDEEKKNLSRRESQFGWRGKVMAADSAIGFKNMWVFPEAKAELGPGASLWQLTRRQV